MAEAKRDGRGQKGGVQMIKNTSIQYSTETCQYENLSSIISFSNEFNDPNIRFIKVKNHSKQPAEKDWTKSANYGFNSPEIRKWVENGGNYGLTSPSGFCVFIDADSLDIQNSLETSLPETLRWSTGNKGHFQYAYFVNDSPMKCFPLTGGAYVKGKGGFAVGPGSIHPNGVRYGSREIRDIPIAIVQKKELLDALFPFIISKSEKNTFHEPLPTGTVKIDRNGITKILVPYWERGDGLRNELTLAIAGFIARSGGTEEDSIFVISKLCELTAKGYDHIPGAKYAFHRDGNVKGLRSLKKLMEVIGNE